MRTARIACLVFGVAAAIGAGQAYAQNTAPNTCFRSRDMVEWKAADAHTMYVSTSSGKYYKVTFNQPCTALTAIGARLITKFHGPDSVCGPNDWDLRVAASGSGSMSCMVSSQTLLSPGEVAAIPSRARP
jgi:hypothetical protein